MADSTYSDPAAAAVAASYPMYGLPSGLSLDQYMQMMGYAPDAAAPTAAAPAANPWAGYQTGGYQGNAQQAAYDIATAQQPAAIGYSPYQGNAQQAAYDIAATQSQPQQPAYDASYLAGYGPNDISASQFEAIYGYAPPAAPLTGSTATPDFVSGLSAAQMSAYGAGTYIPVTSSTPTYDDQNNATYATAYYNPQTGELIMPGGASGGETLTGDQAKIALNQMLGQGYKADANNPAVRNAGGYIIPLGENFGWVGDHGIKGWSTGNFQQIGSLLEQAGVPIDYAKLSQAADQYRSWNTAVYGQPYSADMSNLQVQQQIISNYLDLTGQSGSQGGQALEQYLASPDYQAAAQYDYQTTVKQAVDLDAKLQHMENHPYGSQLMELVKTAASVWGPGIGQLIGPAVSAAFDAAMAGADTAGVMAAADAALPAATSAAANTMGAGLVKSFIMQGISAIDPKLSGLASLASGAVGGVNSLTGGMLGNAASSLLGGAGDLGVAAIQPSDLEDAYLGNAYQTNYNDMLGQVADNADQYLGGAMTSATGYDPNVVESGVNAQLTPDQAVQYGLGSAFTGALGSLPTAMDLGTNAFEGGYPTANTLPDGTPAPGSANGEWDVLPDEVKASPLDAIKPGQVLSLAQKLYGLLQSGGKAFAGYAEANAAVQHAQDIVNAQYKDEAERSAAYSAYAQQLLNFIPSVSEAYANDPAHASNAYGDAYVDPATGEVRYKLNQGSQEYFDQLMQSANDSINQVLGADADKMTADQFEKAVGSLQGKRDADMAKLIQAVYAKGMLGLLTYSGHGVDITSGNEYSWQNNGQGANPYFAAYEARIADENQRLADQSRSSADSYIQQLLNHSGGILGQAQDVDQTMLDTLFNAGQYADENGDIKQKRAAGLYDLLAGPQGAFLEQLMGNLPSGKAASALADTQSAEDARRRALMNALFGE